MSDKTFNKVVSGLLRKGVNVSSNAVTINHSLFKDDKITIGMPDADESLLVNRYQLHFLIIFVSIFICLGLVTLQ